MDIVLLLIVIVLQIIIIYKSQLPKIALKEKDFDENSPYVQQGSPFYTNKYVKEGDK